MFNAMSLRSAIFKSAALVGILAAFSVSASNAGAQDWDDTDPMKFWLGAGAVFFQGDDVNYPGQLYEARLGYDIDPRWTIEGGLGGSPFMEGKDYPAPDSKEGTFNGRNSVGENWMLKANISALYHLDCERTDGWDPYLSVIAGTHFFGKRRQKDSNFEEFAGGGVGVAYWFDKDLALRLDYDVVGAQEDNLDVNQHVLAMVHYNFDSAAEPMPAPAEDLGAKTSPGLSPVYYDFDKSDLSKKAQDTLKKNSAWIKENPGKKVSLEGHTDERGTSEYNMALGMRRAKSAEKYLNTVGVPKDQMSTMTYGEELPADPGHNEAAWSKNRRTESVVKE